MALCNQSKVTSSVTIGLLQEFVDRVDYHCCKSNIRLCQLTCFSILNRKSAQCIDLRSNGLLDVLATALRYGKRFRFIHFPFRVFSLQIQSLRGRPTDTTQISFLHTYRECERQNCIPKVFHLLYSVTLQCRQSTYLGTQGTHTTLISDSNRPRLDYSLRKRIFIYVY